MLKIARIPLWLLLTTLTWMPAAQASSVINWEKAYLRNDFQIPNPIEKLLDPNLALEEPVVTEAAFEQKLVPDDPHDTRTFSQRYFLTSSFAQRPAGAQAQDVPVVLYVCGEAECSAAYMSRLAGEVAKTLGAHIVSLEHRYYGLSQPFADYSVEHLKYLRTDYALADLASFERYARANLGLTGKWVVIGGSYAGSLSALYRQQYPELVVGSLASSAPVEARNDYQEFDYHATVAAGQACADQVRAVIAAAEAALKDPKALSDLKARFEASDITDPDDFLYLLSDLAAESVQYGKRQELCQAMLAGSDPVASYADYVKSFLGWYGASAVSFVAQGGLDLEPRPDNNARPWFYQSCAEWGYWQNAYHDPRYSMRSRHINAAYHARLCQRLFAMNEADDQAMNRSHYLRLLDPAQASRILFTNGSEDPWSELSISSVRGNDRNPRTAVQWIDGGSHCSDLHASADGDSDSLKAARARFSALLQEWMK